MKTNKLLPILALFGASFGISSCVKESLDIATPDAATSLKNIVVDNSREGVADVFYNGKVYSMNMTPLSPNATATMVDGSQTVKELFVYKEIPDRSAFTMVSDDITGEGFNPAWRAIEIEFNRGYTPRQFTSKEGIYAAVNLNEITLKSTDEMYRFTLIGLKQQSER